VVRCVLDRLSVFVDASLMLCECGYPIAVREYVVR
jgi:hypothetical protein